MEIINIAYIVIPLVLIILVLIRNAAAAKKKYDKKIEKADRLIQSAKDAIDSIQPATVTKYVTVESFNESDSSYLSEISEIWNNPIFRFFIVQLQNDVLMAINENPKPELNDGLVGKSKGVELVIKTMLHRSVEYESTKNG